MASDSVSRIPLIVAGCVWAIVQGATAPILGLGLAQTTQAATISGWLTAGYFLSAILFFFPLPWLLEKYGARKLIRISLGISSLALIWIVLQDDYVSWAIARSVQGACSSILLGTVETELMRSASPSKRATVLGRLELFLVVGAGFGAGMAPVLWNSINGIIAGSILAGPALLATYFLVIPESSNSDSPDAIITARIKRGPASAVLLATAFIQGLAEGELMAYLTPAILSEGHSSNTVALGFTALFSGIVISQIGLASKAEIWGHGTVLWISQTAVAAGFGTLAFSHLAWSIVGALGLVGLGLGCQYPVAQAALGNKVQASSLSQAASLFLGVNCLGCLLAAPIGGFAYHFHNWIGLFGTIGIICLLLALITATDCILSAWLAAPE
jgi:MFS family permease